MCATFPSSAFRDDSGRVTLAMGDTGNHYGLTRAGSELTTSTLLNTLEDGLGGNNEFTSSFSG